MKTPSGRVSQGPIRMSRLAAGLVLIGQFAGAATYYVHPNGNDSNAGTITAPFRTIQRAANVASPGDTVLVRDGTYGPEGAITGGDSSDTSRTPVRFTRSGAAGAEITFKSESKWGAVLDCQMICDAYFDLYNASYITIQDFVIRRGYKEAIHSNNAAHHITIRGNRIHNIANRDSTTPLGLDGMYANGNCHDFVIDGNVFHDIGRTNTSQLDHALYLKGYNYTVTNNIFYNMKSGWAIQAANGLSNVLIANNTFAFGAGHLTGQIMLWDVQSNITIRNNIFHQPRNAAITRYNSTLSGCAIDTNIVYGASSVITSSSGCAVGTNRTGVDPKFRNATSEPYDFRVMAGGPGIDTGVELPQVKSDSDGEAGR